SGIHRVQYSGVLQYIGFEEALKQVEANYPEVELDRSVFKPPSRSAAKTQPPVAGNGE
ncbi:hypothetical protein A2U01_0063093, partial [Trifolium medium]|nr:hypothetical protein [Trifolium medium]